MADAWRHVIALGHEQHAHEQAERNVKFFARKSQHEAMTAAMYDFVAPFRVFPADAAPEVQGEGAGQREGEGDFEAMEDDVWA
eukprot:1171064-Heterocapsa_arctica.AAC.1